MLGGQPVHLQRLAGHRAPTARPHPAPRGAGRHARGGRPPALPHRGGGHRAGRDPARGRRLPADGHGEGAHGGTARRLVLRRPRHRARRGGRRGRGLHAGAVAYATGLAADDVRRLARDWPPRPPPACTAASAPPRRSSAPSPRGWSTCSTCSPATSTARAGPCSPPPRRGPATPGGSRASAGPSTSTAAPAGCASCPRPSVSSRPSPWPRRWSTPGEGQLRALLTVAGNPVSSTPNSARLDAAIAGLECVISVDIYVNETTRHADVDPPGALGAAEGPLRRRPPPARAAGHLSNYSEAVLPLDPDQPDEWEVLARLALVLQGAGATADPAIVDDLMITSMVQGSVADETSVIFGRERGRDPRRAGAPPGPGAHPRLPPPHGALRGGVRRRPRRLLPRRVAGQPARHRPLGPSSPASPTCCAPRTA